MAGPVKANVTSMAGQFVAGATPADLVKRLRRNAEAGIATTIDLLGETVVSEAEADAFLQRNLEVLDTVSKAMAKDGACFSDLGPEGPLPRINLSVKVSALTPEVHPADPERSIDALKERLRPILRRAAREGAFINFDMESYAFKDLTLALFKSILSEDEFRGARPSGSPSRPTFATRADLGDLIGWARQGRTADRGPPREGRLLGLRDDPRRPRGGRCRSGRPRREATPTTRSCASFSCAMPTSSAPPSPHTMSARAPTPSPRPTASGSIPGPTSSRPSTGWPTSSRRPWWRRAARARILCRWANSFPGWPTWSAGSSKTPPNEDFLRAKDSGGATRDKLLRNPVELLAPASPAASSRRRGPLAFRNAPNTDFTGGGQPGPDAEQPSRRRRRASASGTPGHRTAGASPTGNR